MSSAPYPMSFNELSKRIATRGDLATVLIAAPIGFVGDIALGLAGIVSPGACAVLTASTALGIKNGVQAMLPSKPAAVDHAAFQMGKQAVDQSQSILGRANALARSIASLRADELPYDLSDEATEHLRRLESEIELFQQGITDENTFARAVNSALKFYRREKHLDDGEGSTDEAPTKVRRSRRITLD
jgi:hypothetical protein